MTRRTALGAWLVLTLVSVPSLASAAWTGASDGTASTRATSLPAPSQPTASASGSSVTVSWSAASISGTVDVSGYVVRRYDGTGSASSIGGSCAGTVTELTCTDTSVPSGTWRYSVAARKGSWVGEESARSGSITIASAPSVTSVTLQKTSGGTAEFIRQGGTYHVYANVTEGTPSGGLIVTANVSMLTTAQIATPLTNGSWTVNGVAYGYRTAQLTADAALIAGSKNVTVTATQNAQVAQRTATVTVDNTPPTATDVQTTNGGVAGKVDVGDRLLLTTSEPLDANSILPGWSSDAIAVTLQFRDSVVTDQLRIWDGTNAAPLPFGSIGLGRNDYVNADVAVSATMVLSGSMITITVGTTSAVAITTAGSAGTMHWTPAAPATDRADNAMSTTAVSESGAADVDF